MIVVNKGNQNKWSKLSSHPGEINSSAKQWNQERFKEIYREAFKMFENTLLRFRSGRSDLTTQDRNAEKKIKSIFHGVKT